MKKGKSLTIKLDDDIYQELQNLSQDRPGNLEEEIEEALKTYIEWKKKYINDPFFHIQSAGRSGLGDLSTAHDKYLYGYMKDEDNA